MTNLFLFRLKDSTERDAVHYLDLETGSFECGHYFAGLRITGACFSGIPNMHELAYNSIETTLTESEIQRLINFNKEINNLGYGIKKGDERYTKGIELRNSIKDILQKLQSVKNEKFFEEIIKSEKEILMEEYNLTIKEVEEIFNEYALDY